METGSLINLNGIGKKKAALFAKLGLHSTADLIEYKPLRYEDKTKITSLADVHEPGKYTFLANVVDKQSKITGNRKKMMVFRLTDGSGELTVVFFNAPYISNFFHQGQSYYIHGQLNFNGMEKLIFHPEFQLESKGPFGIDPVYSSTEGLSQRDFKHALEQLKPEISATKEILPKIFLDRFNLMSYADALMAIHFAKEQSQLLSAVKRLKYQEIFNLQIALKLQKIKLKLAIKRQKYPLENFDPQKNFPFPLTIDQQHAINDIIADLKAEKPMQRLLQGDVGSGKTAVAMAAADFVAQNGYQTALMVPTEILAQQHYQNFCQRLRHLNIAFLSSATKDKEKMCQEIADGKYDIIIGTHAIIQKSVRFANLSLVITDEQHRFGVEQRQELSAKASANPDVLVMSATPIPRTLSLIIYGDMNISVIRTMPKGRREIKTYYISKKKYSSMLDFIEKRIVAGEQAYFVAPLISESDKLPLKAAEELFAELKISFKAHRVELLHGKLKAEEKEEIMQAFKQGEVKVLVATTVIEVGVDVPQATIMVITHSERFGLAQLHQLRGRVGRGNQQSYCFLLVGSAGKLAAERIKMMVKSNDGFAIANRDLELRGPGEILGLRQHGLPDLQYIDLNEDLAIIEEISGYADFLLTQELVDDDYLRWLEAKMAL